MSDKSTAAQEDLAKVLAALYAQDVFRKGTPRRKISVNLAQFPAPDKAALTKRVLALGRAAQGAIFNAAKPYPNGGQYSEPPDAAIPDLGRHIR